MVVAISGKEDLAGVELVQRTADRPHVDSIIVRHAQDDLGRPVEPTHKVRSDLVVRGGRVRAVDSGAEIANLENVATFVDLTSNVLVGKKDKIENEKGERRKKNDREKRG